MLAAIKVQNKYGQSRAYIEGSACHTRSWTPVLKKKKVAGRANIFIYLCYFPRVVLILGNARSMVVIAILMLEECYQYHGTNTLVQHSTWSVNGSQKTK